MREKRLATVSQHNVVYQFKCGLCTSSYISYTCRHLHTRIDEHKLQSYSISKHLREDHGLSSLSSVVQELNFKILKHCNNKFDCLIFEMLYIKHLQPDLNIQSDCQSQAIYIVFISFFLFLCLALSLFCIVLSCCLPLFFCLSPLLYYLIECFWLFRF